LADKETKALFDTGVNIGGRVADQCEKRGLIVRPVGHLNILSPPLTLTEGQIDDMVAILREAIVATIDELCAEGILK
jgi:adenosylmethionine-8-amino-7-oxononanoate aminotransferase